MKRIFCIFIILCFLFPSGVSFSEKADNPPKPVDSDTPQAKPQSDVESPAQPPAGFPSMVPPSSSFTPEQVKQFLKKQKRSDEQYIILNFDNASLRDVINTISSITKENFILSPGLDARITIHSNAKIPSSEALSVLGSILEVNNMTLVKSGRFYKVVPGSLIKQKPIEVQKGQAATDVAAEDRPITQIIPVKYVPVGELAPILQPMLSQFGNLLQNPRNNLLIISDLAASVKRVLTILEEVDVDTFQDTRMVFYEPKYSDAKTISDELVEIVNALNLGREGSIAFVPIERINSLIIFSSSPNLLETVKIWLKKLDEEITAGQKVFVYAVQNVDANSIADILNIIYKEDGAQTRRTQQTQTQQTTQQRQRRQRTQQRRVTTPTTTRGSSRVEIVTFEPTNSLVILAPPGMYREIVETIKRLDVYPQEVLIEGIIAEVTLTDTDQYGVQWSALHSVHIENDPDFTGLSQGTVNLEDAPPLSTVAPALGSGPAAGISYFLFKPDRLAALIHALSSRGKVNLLSSPRLLVRDQEEANIEVGSDIPTASSTTSATTTETLTQNIEYRTVGVKLKIKPTINDEKTVVLDLEQEVSSIGSSVQVGQTGNLFPSFNVTKTKTSIVVPDKQGIIIGGIMEDTKGKNYQGIPILSSIPILGNLFRYTVNDSTKKELIILITPHVIMNKNEADVLTLEFMDKLKNVKQFIEESNVQLGSDYISPQGNAGSNVSQ